MEKIKDILNKYSIYIFITIIIILIIIIGFMWSYKVTKESENDISYNPVKETKEDEKAIEIYKVEIKGQVKHPGVYELHNGDRVIDVVKKADGLTLNADTSYVNLSKKIFDEMVIIIYSKEEIKEYKKKIAEENNKKNEIPKYEEIKEDIVCPNVINDSCIKEENIINNQQTKNTDSSNKQDDNNNLNQEEKEDDNNNINQEEKNKININTASKEELLTLDGIGESKADKIIEYRSKQLFNSIEDIKNITGIGDSIFEKIKDNIIT